MARRDGYAIYAGSPALLPLGCLGNYPPTNSYELIGRIGVVYKVVGAAVSTVANKCPNAQNLPNNWRIISFGFVTDYELALVCGYYAGALSGINTKYLLSGTKGEAA